MRETLREYCLREEKTQLLSEWDAARNGELTPDTVTASSGKRVWWRCAKGHTWQAAVYARTKQNAGCPYCSNRLVWQGYNDLASQAPEIAKEWYQPLNGNKTPETVNALWRFMAQREITRKQIHSLLKFQCMIFSFSFFIIIALLTLGAPIIPPGVKLRLFQR